MEITSDLAQIKELSAHSLPVPYSLRWYSTELYRAWSQQGVSNAI